LHRRAAPVAAEVAHELALGGVDLVAADDVLKLHTATSHYLKPKARVATTTTAFSKQKSNT
jgi:hypothetical protein